MIEHGMGVKRNVGYPVEELVSDWSTMEHEDDEFMGGILVPYEIAYNVVSGRGVFATDDIKEGTLIWTPTNLATFDPIEDYRDFVESVLEDPTMSAIDANTMACDIALWGFRGLKRHGLVDEINQDHTIQNPNGTQTVHKNRVLIHDTVQCLVLDDGSLFNHADPETMSMKLNMEYQQMNATQPDENDEFYPVRANNFNCGYGYGLYAIRDIVKGEELRYDYDYNQQETPDDVEEMDELVEALKKEKAKEAIIKTKEYKKFVRMIPNPDTDSDQQYIVGSDEWDAWYVNPIRQQSDLLADLTDLYDSSGRPINDGITCPNANDTHGIIDNFYPPRSDGFWKSNGKRHYSLIPTVTDTWEPMIDNYFAVTQYDLEEYGTARKSFINNGRFQAELFDDADEKKKSRSESKKWVYKTGFNTPIEVRYVDEVIGRGVYATEFIREGTFVYHPRNVAEFRQKEDFRTFVERLKDPTKNVDHQPQIKSLACDSIIWSTIEIKDRYNRKDTMICLPLDEGSLLNNGMTNRTANNLVKMNLLSDVATRQYDDEHYTCADRGFYAKRDIQPGEELRFAYNPKDDEPEVFKPTMDEWRTFLKTGGTEELLTPEKKQPILDAMHCYDEAEYDYIYEGEDFKDLFEYFMTTFKNGETKRSIGEGYNTDDSHAVSAFKGYPIVRNNKEEYYQDSLSVDHEVRLLNDGRRRGVFATQDIKEGTLIWSPSTTVQFYPMIQYYRFIEKVLMEGDNSMACDIVNWTYNTEDGKMLCIAFDDGSMMNGIEVDQDDDTDVENKNKNENINVGWNKSDDKYGLYNYEFGCQYEGELYATRDIKKGEELNYWRPKRNAKVYTYETDGTIKEN